MFANLKLYFSSYTVDPPSTDINKLSVSELSGFILIPLLLLCVYVCVCFVSVVLY